MISTKQKVFMVFLIGLVMISTSILFKDTQYFLSLLMVGMWLVILSTILYKMYVVRTQAPTLSVARKEQFISNLALLLKKS